MTFFRVLTAFWLLLWSSGLAKGEFLTVDIDDLTTNVAVTINGVPATLLPDSNGEFVHFTIPFSKSFNASGVSYSNDLWEGPNGPVSDRLLQTGHQDYLDVQFGSVPGNLPAVGVNVFPVIVEDGSMQHITDTSILFGDNTPTSNGTEDNFSFFVQSDVPGSGAPVPEPSSLILAITFIGSWGVLGACRRRQRHQPEWRRKR